MYIRDCSHEKWGLQQTSWAHVEKEKGPETNENTLNTVPVSSCVCPEALVLDIAFVPTRNLTSTIKHPLASGVAVNFLNNLTTTRGPR